MSTLLEDITSGDPHRIWASSCAIATLRDVSELNLLSAHLPEIEEKTRDIDLGGALFPNNKHLDFALRKLHYFKSNKGCLCRLYPDHLVFDPTREAQAGNVRIIETNNDVPYSTVTLCQCILCNTIFRVEEGEYHYTWWKWTVLKSNDTSLRP